MSNIIEYKGYKARIGVDADKMIIVGEIIIPFHAANLHTIRKEFEAVVDIFLKGDRKNYAPNSTTIKILEESKREKSGKTYSCAEDLFQDLGIA